jgi:hypothetical protein
MALYHFTAKAVSFGKGQSAVHTAAYNARTQLAHDRESRITKNYADKGGLEFSGIFAPPGAPAWTQDREAVWNRAEAAERQANGQPARNVEFALPHELDAEQRRRLVTDFARETFARRGMIADVAIHAPHGQNDARNYHVHCLLTMRRLDGDGFAKTKERAWNTKAELAAWKEKWAEMGARALERAGFAIEAARFRHGHQTLPKQREAALERGDLDFAAGLDREATIHKGPAVSAMESRDDPRLATNETFQEARGIAERNQARAEIRITEQELFAARGAAVETALPAVLRPEAPILAATAAEAPGAVQAGQEARPRTNTIGDIRLAYTLSPSGPSFAEGLEARGLSLAVVSAEEAASAARLASFAKEVGNYAARYAEGELVAVNRFGGVYRLNERTTGDSREEVASYLATVDRAPLLSVTETRDALGEANRADFIHGQALQRAMDRPLSAIETALEETRAGAQNAAEFVAGLQGQGLYLARATAEDIPAIQAAYLDSQADQRAAFMRDEFASSLSRSALRIEPGDLVAVADHGGIYRLASPGLDHDALASAWIEGSEIEGRKLRGVMDVRAEAMEARAEHAAFWNQIRDDRAAALLDRATDLDAVDGFAVSNTADDLVDGLAGAARGIGKLADGVGDLAVKSIDALANLFGGGGSAAPTQTPKQEKAPPMSARDRRHAEHAAIIAAERMAHLQQLQETAKAMGYSPDTPMNEEELRRDQETRRGPGHSR